MHNTSSNIPLRDITSTLNPWFATVLFSITIYVILKKISHFVPTPLLVGVELNPGPPRSNPRRSKRRVSQRKSTRGSYSEQYLQESDIGRFPKPTVCLISKASGPFPDIYRNTLKTRVLNLLNGGPTIADSYVINGPMYLFGPQRGWTGAFSANFPAGAKMLLGTSGATGSTAPYRFSTITQYRFEIELRNTATSPCVVVVIPSINPDYTAMPQSTLLEQRGAMKVSLPPTSSDSQSHRLRMEGSISQLFGVTSQEVNNDIRYSQVVGAQPTLQAYLHIISFSVDGTNTSVYTEFIAYLDCKFSGLNTLNSSSPV